MKCLSSSNGYIMHSSVDNVWQEFNASQVLVAYMIKDNLLDSQPVFCNQGMTSTICDIYCYAPLILVEYAFQKEFLYLSS